MPREMRFLDIPDGNQLPGDWRRKIDSDEFDAHIAIIETAICLRCMVLQKRSAIFTQSWR